MAVNTASVGQLASKFRGCLMGALAGDCIGAPFEEEFPISKSVLSNYFKRLITQDPIKGSILAQPYTDDTAMTRALAESLIAKKGFDPKDMAQRFTAEYYRQPKRGYGLHVIDVFEALRASEYEDPYGPAKMQFNGTGSYGNGGAMRISPVALFCYNDEDKLISVAKHSALITHTHRNGYNGAILQSIAIHQALKSDPTSQLNSTEYLDVLINKIEAIEKETLNEHHDPESEPLCYTSQLKKMKEIMQLDDNELSAEEAAVLFGNSVAALKSVPLAIYAFLRGLKQTSDYEFQVNNSFLRTLYFAISAGGDTDTIASMAASIAGAYSGITSIPENVQKICEDWDKALNLADQLLKIVDQ